MNDKLRTVCTEIAERYARSIRSSLSGAPERLVNELAKVQQVTLLLAMNEFAVQVASYVLAEQFDETPSNVNSDPVAIAEDRGYRRGHNASRREVAGALTGKVKP